MRPMGWSKPSKPKLSAPAGRLRTSFPVGSRTPRALASMLVFELASSGLAPRSASTSWGSGIGAGVDGFASMLAVIACMRSRTAAHPLAL